MRRCAGCRASLSCPSTPDPSALRASRPPLPQDLPLPSRAALSSQPRATLEDPAAGPPHLSAGLAKPPDLLCCSRLREPPPGHPPRVGGGGDSDPDWPLHAPGRAAGGCGASHAGRGRWGGARSPVSQRGAQAGHPGSGRGAGGRSPGARPRGCAPPPRSARRAGTRTQGGGNRRRRRRAADAGAPRPAPRRGVRAQPARSAPGRAVPLRRVGGGTLRALAPARHLSARSAPPPPRASAA